MSFMLYRIGLLVAFPFVFTLSILDEFAREQASAFQMTWLHAKCEWEVFVKFWNMKP